MSNRNLLWICCVLLAAGCATMPAQDDATARPAIERQAAAWADAVNRGDWGAVAALYTTDALMLAPNTETLRGREAIRGFIETLGGLSVRDVRLTVNEVEVCGDTAFETGSYSMSLQPPGQARMTDRGKYLVVWKRQADGSWRIHRDIFNTSLPMAH
ncbi:MAG TPA: SgcJ/EcaC family oxidoreductase [Thermoanaerobaculia bacterium]|nr:SgcJ/EcaC family oxidoreductase [Thermoanaerobaculia bacterium]